MSGRRIDPPGTTPWDRWHGARIGGLVGGIGSALLAAWIEPFPFGIVLGCAALGAVIGYATERRRSR